MGTKHSMEFRQEAVRVALTSGLTRKQVAADFGLKRFRSIMRCRRGIYRQYMRRCRMRCFAVWRQSHGTR